VGRGETINAGKGPSSSPEGGKVSNGSGGGGGLRRISEGERSEIWVSRRQKQGAGRFYSVELTASTSRREGSQMGKGQKGEVDGSSGRKTPGFWGGRREEVK